MPGTDPPPESPEDDDATIPFERPGEEEATVPFERSEDEVETVASKPRPQTEPPANRPVSHIEQQTEQLEYQRAQLARDLETLKRAQRKRHFAIFAAVVVAVAGSALAAYLIKGGRILVDDLPGTEAFEEYLQQSERDREASDWQRLLATAVQADRDLAARPEFAEIYAYGRPRIIESANAALDGLSAELRAGQLIESPEEVTLLLENLRYVADWGVSDEIHLIEAHYRLARSLGDESGTFLDALRAFRRSIAVDPGFSESLIKPFGAAIDGAIAVQVKNGRLGNESEIARELVDFPRDILESVPRSALLFGSIRINEGFEMEDYETCLNELKSLFDYDPTFKTELSGRVDKIIAAVSTQPTADIVMLAPLLADVADRWEIESVFILLADNANDPNDRFRYFKRAAELGDARAGIEIQRYKLILGAQENRPELIEEAVSELEKAAAEGSPRAAGILAQVLIYGEVTAKDLKRGEALAKKAVAAGETLPLYALGLACLELGEQEDSDARLKEAAETIRRAIDAGVAEPGRHPWFHLYTAHYRLEDHEAAFRALNDGAEKGEPLCLGELGQWWEKGEAPAWEDLPKAREFYAQAAELGDPISVKWCREYEAKNAGSGTEEDREWIRRHRHRWAE